MFIKLAWHSLMQRKGSVSLAILSVAVSLILVLGIEQLRSHTQSSFGRTVSGVDLIVGAPAGELNLLLYSVFHIGNASNLISWESYQEFAQYPQVNWTVPLSLGDSHRGYRVVGTTEGFVNHYHYGKKRPLEFSSGQNFVDTFSVILGAKVARELNYQLGDTLKLSHGLVGTHFTEHGENPFIVSGILKPTGTPVDRALYVSLAGLEAVHGADVEHGDLVPENITAFMLGLNSPIATFQVQRKVNEYSKEPLMAILPGIALSELWRILGGLEKVLFFVSAMVVVAALLGLCILLLSTMRERRSEMALLRTVGSGPVFLFLLVETEALLVLLLGVIMAVSGLVLGGWLVEPLLADQLGIYLDGIAIGERTIVLLGLVLACTLIVAAFPAISACRRSLGDNYLLR
ncbi:peptide ABC transporter permease [Microbulbifer sp. A4B17]|uniref:ABC transporter permease n=1 Tax=Microbulbifer sp. A4B17 TaxID=359370 RepID=UPI000D52BB86|nr:ABC transporter permease [Microbulbifer sp. A4B17]AWF81218.1 peptide ABC transporter permease [Microbulbifer sp. A4B17]